MTLDVVVYGVVGHLTGCLIENTTKFRFLIARGKSHYYNLLACEALSGV